MNHGSLFSGIGGFDLAAEWMGWNNVFHCEWMPFPRQILKYHFPNSISHEDITKTNFTIHRGNIDILTGGFPCQPYSVAGKRLGKEDERHLWPQMLRAIQEIEPTFVVGENVRGIVNWNGGMVFDEVQTDLENAGYEVIPFILPACAVGAPHRRDRVWFIAKNTKRNGCLFREFNEEGTKDGKQRDVSARGSNGVCISKGLTSDTNSGRLEGSIKVGRNCVNVGRESEFRVTSDPNNRGEGGEKIEREWRKYKQQRGQVRSKLITGCEASNWQDFPTQSPICSGDDGLPSQLDGITFSKWRNESIKGYGNAIVPQVAYEIFKAIENTII